MADQVASALISLGTQHAKTAQQLNVMKRSETHGVFTQQQTVNGVYNATVFDGTLFADTSGGVVTVNLPTAVNLAGRIFIVTDIGNAAANNVTIAPQVGETISGSGSVTMTSNYQSIMVQSNGSDWFIVASYP